MYLELERKTREERAADRGPSGSTPLKRLRGPVGIRGGKQQVANHVSDQQTVMSMLDNLKVDFGGNRRGDGSLEVVWPLPIEGKCHVILWTMILRVQNFFYTVGGTKPPSGMLGFLPDGVVDPNGRTEYLVNSYRGDSTPFPADNVKELAKAAVPVALRWVQGAKDYLLRYKVWRLGARRYHFDANAARIHLHLEALDDGHVFPKIEEWMENYRMINSTLLNSERVFVRATREEALAERNGMLCWGITIPAWARFNQHIWFGPDMIGLGPNCRAAILLHEAGHYIRQKIGHTGGERGSQYDRQSADDALSSAYVCANFATHAATGRDERFGLARSRE